MSSGTDTGSSGFGLLETDEIFVCRCERAGAESESAEWATGEFCDWRRIDLSPASAVLSYGLSVFEGLKAERGVDGDVRLFRGEDHGRRLARSAAKLLMPPFPIERFRTVAAELVRRNHQAIPDPGSGALYLRPVLFATEPRLGLGRCESFALVIYASPVGRFFADSERGTARLETIERRRTAPGMGATKCSANYASVIADVESSRTRGFDDLLFVEPGQDRWISETSGANLFVRFQGGEVATPAATGDIFPGMTRDSVLRLAADRLSIEIVERLIGLEEIQDQAVEVFCTGTAWSVVAIGEIVDGASSHRFPKTGVQNEVLKELRSIQTGRSEDRFEWTEVVET